MCDTARLYIDGRWRDGRRGECIAIVNPATEEPVGELAVAAPKDLQDALDAAARGFQAWREVPAAQRSRQLAHVGQLLLDRSTP